MYMKRVAGPRRRLPVNDEARLKPQTAPPRHQGEPLLRLSLEFITVVQPPRPNNDLEFRTRTEEFFEYLIDVIPVSPKRSRRLGQLRRESAQLEHELGEAERGVAQEICAGGF